MRKIYSFLLLVTLSLALNAQVRSFDEYMTAVAGKNITYLVEQYNIDIATSRLQAAKVFNDPELSVEYGNNQDRTLQMGQSLEVGLSYDLDLSGVRRSGIRVADNEKSITEASVAAYLNELRLEAASAWAEAWKLRENCSVLRSTLEDMRQIARSDSLRLVLGDVSPTDALQSRLEANSLEAEWLAMEADYRNSLLTLSYYCAGEEVLDLDESLPLGIFVHDRNELSDMAVCNRADLKVAELTRTLSENNLALVRASRSFDMGISVGYSYNTEVRNEIAPAPKYNGLTVGVTIPLKFSGINRGDVKAARAEVIQAEKAYEAACMQVRMEVFQAMNSLDAAKTVLSRFDSSMVDDAQKIMENRKTAYLKGDSTLLELLAAQQTCRDVMRSYAEASADCFLRRMELEYAVGGIL